jgi:hypothetical protein
MQMDERNYTVWRSVFLAVTHKVHHDRISDDATHIALTWPSDFRPSFVDSHHNLIRTFGALEGVKTNSCTRAIRRNGSEANGRPNLHRRLYCTYVEVDSSDLFTRTQYFLVLSIRDVNKLGLCD